MKKRYVLIVLAALLSAAVCFAGGDREDATGSAPASFNASGYPIVDEPITLNFLVRRHPNAAEFSQMTLWQSAAAETNINIDWTAVPRDSYAERLNLILASGDLPDVFFGPNALSLQQVVQLGSEGALIPQNDLIDDYSVHLRTLFSEYPAIQAAATAPDGNIYSLPQSKRTGIFAGQKNLFINTSWLDQLGLEMPQTTEEFRTVLEAFRGQDPNGNGEADEIPFTFMFDGFSYLGSLYGAFGLPDFGHDSFAIVDGEVIYVQSTENFRSAVAYFHEFFADGLFDEEGITQNFQEFTAKGSTDDAIVGSYSTWYKHFVAGSRVNDYAAMPPLAGPNGERAWPVVGGEASAIFPQTYSISSQNEHPEASFRWADMFYEKERSIEMQFGTLGVVIGENEDGTYRYLPVPDGMVYAEFRFQHTPVDGPSAIFPEDLNTLLPRFDAMQEKYEDIQDLYVQHMTVNEVPDVYLTRDENDTIVRLMGDIASYVEETHAHWLLQGGIESEWDSYIARLDQMGLSEVLEVQQAAYDRFRSAMRN